MLRNSARDWGAAAKTLHWLIFILVAFEIPAGLFMTGTFGPGFDAPEVKAVHATFEQIHHTLGFLILGLVLVRLAWRLRGPVPETIGASSRTMRWAAHATHGLLYLGLLLLPLTGWAALSVLGDTPSYGHIPIWFLNIDGLIPPLLPQRPISDPFGYGFFGKTHIKLLFIGGAILAIHVAAALWHHFVRGDRVLIRMWPMTGPEDSSRS